MAKWMFMLLLLPALAFGGEECAPIGGTCREVCAGNEEAAVGAFIDCSDKQECCVPKDRGKQPEAKKDQALPEERKEVPHR